MAAPIVPASSPANAPATRGRVGAMSFITQNAATNAGIESMAMLNGHTFQERRGASPRARRDRLPACITAPSIQMSATGTSAATPARPRRMPGRANARLRQGDGQQRHRSPSFTQNIGVRAACDRSGRSRGRQAS
jgi:hypothetical protein